MSSSSPAFGLYALELLLGKISWFHGFSKSVNISTIGVAMEILIFKLHKCILCNLYCVYFFVTSGLMIMCDVLVFNLYKEITQSSHTFVGSTIGGG